MSKFQANVNVPIEAIDLARQHGLDVIWIKEVAPAADDTVLALAMAENRVLVTFDKDFGEMAFHRGNQATCSVILFRPRLRNPDYLARFMLTVLSQQVAWEGNFSVAREGQLRVVPLP